MTASLKSKTTELDAAQRTEDEVHRLAAAMVGQLVRSEAKDVRVHEVYVGPPGPVDALPSASEHPA